jgi:hypothetical protein
MPKRASCKALAEYDETQPQLNIKLERGLGLGRGAGERKEMQSREREILIAIVWPVDPRQMTRSSQAASNTDI